MEEFSKFPQPGQDIKPKGQEIIINNPEEEMDKERIPTPEEVASAFEKLIDKREYTEIRKCEDEQGVYLYEVKIHGDLPGEEIEYAYMRKGEYKEGSTSGMEINVTYYENGMAVSGTSAARFIYGKWKIF